MDNYMPPNPSSITINNLDPCQHVSNRPPYSFNVPCAILEPDANSQFTPSPILRMNSPETAPRKGTVSEYTTGDVCYFHHMYKHVS